MLLDVTDPEKDVLIALLVDSIERSLPSPQTDLLHSLLPKIGADTASAPTDPAAPLDEAVLTALSELRRDGQPDVLSMVLALFQAASMTRFVRSAMLDVIRLDYVTTARAKGLGQARVIVKHAMRNAMIPVVTLVALQMPAVFGGAIVTEQIFRIPGIGSLLISSILSNDTPVVMAVTFVFACLVVLFNLIADVLYGWLDPRISLR